MPCAVCLFVCGLCACVRVFVPPPSHGRFSRLTQSSPLPLHPPSSSLILSSSSLLQDQLAKGGAGKKKKNGKQMKVLALRSIPDLLQRDTQDDLRGYTHYVWDGAPTHGRISFLRHMSQSAGV